MAFSRVPLFHQRIYELVDDPAWDSIISWSESNKGFVIRDQEELIRRDIFSNFHCSSFTGFISELKEVGFREIKRADGLWEFGHKLFVRGQPELMEMMHFKVYRVRMDALAKALKVGPRRMKVSKTMKLKDQVTDGVQNLRI